MIAKMIKEDKLIVLKTLRKYFSATDKEIKQFEVLVENEGFENWTCGFDTELVPFFLEMREDNKEKSSDD
tara:strand:- start:2759 stop:2968 length:210 start_codon:yes stop_codon:yes gene_type:complete